MSPGGLALHNIDYSDHFARSTGASRFNFLRYSERDWRRFNSSFQYVNRLRHSQYIELFQRLGFELVEQTPAAGELPADVLRELAPDFQGFAAEDLSILRAFVVARWPVANSWPRQP